MSTLSQMNHSFPTLFTQHMGNKWQTRSHSVMGSDVFLLSQETMSLIETTRWMARARIELNNVLVKEEEEEVGEVG